MIDVVVIENPIYRGEGKWFKFTLSRDGAPMDLSTSTFGFFVKNLLTASEYAYKAPHEAFDTTNLDTGIVRVNMPASATITMTSGTYFAQLQTTRTVDTDVDLTQLIKFKLKDGAV